MNYLDKTGLTYLWSKLKSTFALKKATTINLSTSGWTSSNGSYVQTASISGVTSTSLVIVAPAPGSRVEYGNCGVVCTAQGSGTLTFTALMQPTSSINVNVINMG